MRVSKAVLSMREKIFILFSLSSFDSLTLPIAASRTVKLGGTVATVGFPDIGLQGFAPKLAKGEIASLAGAADDPLKRELQLRARGDVPQGGMSPLILIRRKLEPTHVGCYGGRRQVNGRAWGGRLCAQRLPSK
jgi:hypothetical protein